MHITHESCCREKTFAEEVETLLPELADYLQEHPCGGEEPQHHMSLLFDCNRVLRKAVQEVENDAVNIKQLRDNWRSAQSKLVELRRTFEIACDILSAGKSGMFGD